MLNNSNTMIEKSVSIFIYLLNNCKDVPILKLLLENYIMEENHSNFEFINNLSI
jgi:hypothetical protein